MKCQYGFFIYISLFLISGCSYNNIYEVDKITETEVTEKIVGIKDLYLAGAKNVNIVFIHGMGHHPQNEELSKKGSIKLYQDKLAKKLNFQEIINKKAYWPRKLYLENSTIVGGQLSLRQFSNTNEDTLNMFALSWDEITTSIQKAMFELDEQFYERNGSKDREKDRAYLNRELKRFINRSFADPAIYIGSFGKEIRYIVSQGILEIDSTLAENEYLNDPSTNQIVIIADSLGSSVALDTIKETESIDKNMNKLQLKINSSVQRFAGLSTLIFMNANQLPLIELGKIKGPTRLGNLRTRQVIRRFKLKTAI